MAEDLDAQEAHRRRHALAVPFQLVPGGVARLVQVHLHTIQNIEERLSWQREALHVRRTDASPTRILIENTSGSAVTGENADIVLTNTVDSWTVRNNTTGDFIINTGALPFEMILESNGNMTLAGTCSDTDGAGGTQDCNADYVFDDDYEMLTLEELEAFIAANKHLPNVPSTADIEQNGHNVKSFSYAVLAKVEELVLYTLQQQKTIDKLEARLESLEKRERTADQQ